MPVPRGRCVPPAGLPAAWAHTPVGLGGTERGTAPRIPRGGGQEGWGCTGSSTFSLSLSLPLSLSLWLSAQLPAPLQQGFLAASPTSGVQPHTPKLLVPQQGFVLPQMPPALYLPRPFLCAVCGSAGAARPGSHRGAGHRAGAAAPGRLPGPRPTSSPSCSCRASEQPRFDKVPALITSERLPASPKVPTVCGRTAPSVPGVPRRDAGAPALPAPRSRHVAAARWPRGGRDGAGDVAGRWRSRGSCRRTKPPGSPSCKGGQRLSSPGSGSHGAGRVQRDPGADPVREVPARQAN